jgi:hypothetical protein
MEEAKTNYQEVVKLSKSHPETFTPEDLKKLEMNAQFFNK